MDCPLLHLGNTEKMTTYSTAYKPTGSDFYCKENVLKLPVSELEHKHVSSKDEESSRKEINAQISTIESARYVAAVLLTQSPTIESGDMPHTSPLALLE